jgi:ATP-dependent DNA helicase RecG
MPGFRIGRMDLHQDLLKMARDDAILALQRDPTLTSERGAALRLLLYVFERDEAIRLMNAG